MWSLLTLFGLIGFILCFKFLWVPSEETSTTPATLVTTKTEVAGATTLIDTRLVAERRWYGITFHGYQDNYCFETEQSPQDALRCVREFFLGRNARILIEESHHLRLSRGRTKIQAYLTGLDTWFPQTIDIFFQTRPQTTMVMIKYDVPGIHIRIPPNQLRREALELRSTVQLAAAKPSASPNGGPAMRSGDFQATKGPPL